ncbi:hypothetical protein HY251_02670, partial [bacterium]|nr:hypothetical protein [bacterium]
MEQTTATRRTNQHVLLRRLGALRSRTRVHLAIDGVASTCLAFVSICVASFGVDRIFRLPLGQRAFMLLLLALAVGTLVWRRLVARVRVALPLHELARQVEKLQPSLDWRLVSAVQFLEGADPRGSRELAGIVVEQAERAASPLDFTRTLDTNAVAWRAARGGVVLACGLALVMGFPDAAKTWFLRCILLSSTEEWPKNTRLHISPYEERRTKTVAIPRGADLAIVVTASGDQPSRMTLSFECEGSKAHGTRNLASLGKNRFRYL